MKKPVEKIELSEEHKTVRLVLTILFALLAVAAITYGVMSLFTAQAGWQKIEAASKELNCAEDFTFYYRLGAGDASATAENKSLSAVYGQASEYAFQQFTNDLEYTNVHNVRYINLHPNEDLKVDELLYKAFSLVAESGDRSIYLAPVYEQYMNLFTATDDVLAQEFDPYCNLNAASTYQELANFAQNPDAVNLVLLDNSSIRLYVSEEFLAYAEKNGITSFIDFTWMKNAFIADYLADSLISAGYTRGCLTSVDGFIRNLDGSGETYAYNIAHRMGEYVYPAARMDYTGPVSLVCLKDYGFSSVHDRWRFYTYSNGDTRTLYLDTADGRCKNAIGSLVCYSEKQSCAELLLQMIPIYISDHFQPERLKPLTDEGVYTIYCQDWEIIYNDPDLTFAAVYSEEDGEFQTRLVS